MQLTDWYEFYKLVCGNILHTQHACLSEFISLAVISFNFVHWPFILLCCQDAETDKDYCQSVMQNIQLLLCLATIFKLEYYRSEIL